MSDPIKVAIRVDANAALGTGHFGRVASVFDALSVYDNVDIILLIGAQSVPYVPIYFPADAKYITLTDAEDAPQDAIDKLLDQGFGPDVVYLDHYGQISEWETTCREMNIPLAIIDDMNEARDASIIFRSIPDLTNSDASGRGFVYAGPAYIPLSKTPSAKRTDQPSAPLRVNVCFGGSDPTGETGKLIDVLASAKGMVFDVIIGPGSKITSAQEEAFTRIPHIQCHRAPSKQKLYALLCDADFSLGAGGVMQWERLNLGVPSIVMTVAENQKPQINWMQHQGLLHYLGDQNTVTGEQVRDALIAFRDDPNTRRQIADKGMKLVDARGALRIAAGIRSLALSVRGVTMNDAQNLFDWRTHEFNWKFNFSTAPKPEYDFHVDWLAMKLGEPECMYFIIQQGDDPVSVVRFDVTPDGDNARLSIYLVPDQHGKKLGLAVYMAAEQALRAKFPNVSGVHSYIHVNNHASKRLHTDAGFELSPSAQKDIMLDAKRTF
jgi:spore coat polysaccharide biosynthesis predicted glycosyltransferase SpsG/RimJ/RimL family protein N-acetyltransferase